VVREDEEGALMSAKPFLVRSHAAIGCGGTLSVAYAHELLQKSVPGSAKEAELAAEFAKQRNQYFAHRRGWLSRLGVHDGRMTG
jgi:hypothetical protein